MAGSKSALKKPCKKASQVRSPASARCIERGKDAHRKLAAAAGKSRKAFVKQIRDKVTKKREQKALYTEWLDVYQKSYDRATIRKAQKQATSGKLVNPLTNRPLHTWSKNYAKMHALAAAGSDPFLKAMARRGIAPALAAAHFQAWSQAPKPTSAAGGIKRKLSLAAAAPAKKAAAAAPADAVKPSCKPSLKMDGQCARLPARPAPAKKAAAAASSEAAKPSRRPTLPKGSQCVMMPCTPSEPASKKKKHSDFKPSGRFLEIHGINAILAEELGKDIMDYEDATSTEAVVLPLVGNCGKQGLASFCTSVWQRALDLTKTGKRKAGASAGKSWVKNVILTIGGGEGTHYVYAQIDNDLDEAWRVFGVDSLSKGAYNTKKSILAGWALLQKEMPDLLPLEVELRFQGWQKGVCLAKRNSCGAYAAYIYLRSLKPGFRIFDIPEPSNDELIRLREIAETAV